MKQSRFNGTWSKRMMVKIVQRQLTDSERNMQEDYLMNNELTRLPDMTIDGQYISTTLN